jgi:hypothetical protein
MYVVSVAGAKMYGLRPDRWSDRVGTQNQLYQHIRIEGDTLEFASYTITGKLYDSFKLVKQEQKANLVIESSGIRKTKESVGIPETYMLKYSQEDLHRYRSTYGPEITSEKQ